MERNEVVDYYDSIAESYDESRFHNSYGRFIDTEERWALDELINLKDNPLRLDMACGTGRLTHYATHGLDASSEMMRRAQERFPDVEFRLASACETGYPDGMFDVVYTFHFLMHLDLATIRQIFDEVHRILKPGGSFIMDIPSKKRRQLLHHKQASWHGGTEMSTADIQSLCGDTFHIERTLGLMMLPVHKLPQMLRKPLQRLDYALANSCFKEYSSYLLFKLVKR